MRNIAPTQKHNATRTVLRDNDSSWTRVPFLVSFGNDFTNVLQSIQYVADAGDGISNDSKKIKGTDSTLDEGNIADYFGIDYPTENVQYLSYPHYTDTRVGGNDAINCLWQFGRDDDIVHPIHMTDQNAGIGMGRVYAETINRNQSIAYFTFGVPVFTDFVKFFKTAADENLIKYNLTGGFSMSAALSRMFTAVGNAMLLAISAPILSFKWIASKISGTKNTNIDRFYDLRATMASYYRYVDSILTQWCIAAGFYGNPDQENFNLENDALPDLMKDEGLSIFNIMSLRGRLLAKRRGLDPNYDWENDLIAFSTMAPSKYDNLQYNDNGIDGDSGGDVDELSTDYGMNDDSQTALWSNTRIDFTRVLKDSVFGATQWIGMRIEKSTDASESFSNSTAPSGIAEQINSKIRENVANSSNMGVGGGEMASGDAPSMFQQAISKVSDILTGAASVVGFQGLGEAVVSGAFIDIPDQYSSSEFNKSHSLNFQLRAPYGDMISIYQSIIVPLALLLAGALPRASGKWSYSQPFLCRVYSRGLFAVPLGIIESISIRRGSSEFGWTYRNLPTRVDVSLSIKDLSPVMYMAMNDSMFSDVFQSNSSFHEYMLTLSGVGLRDRILRFNDLVRKFHTLAARIRNRLTNPAFWAQSIADTGAVTAISNVVPYSTVPFG